MRRATALAFPAQRSSLLKCAPQPKIATKILKPPILAV